MTLSLEELVKIILMRSEQLEDELKKESEIRELSVNQLHCIELIMEKGNPGLSELARSLKITRPSVTVMIDRLEDHGYVRRVRSDTDRRSAHVHLTDKGVRAGQLHDTLHRDIASMLTSALSEQEKEIMVVLLNKAMVEF